MFKGGDNSDIDSEDSSKMKDPTKGPMRIRVFFSTRSGRLATRLQLFWLITRHVEDTFPLFKMVRPDKRAGSRISYQYLLTLKMKLEI